ncbi:MAG TPA: alanine--tRNA ligase [Acidimicrobiales bacterium]|jgi:alanyl-tRNA synthetase|nr:alanine--tRNA ligase [Acidimicrobiales bacterium]
MDVDQLRRAFVDFFAAREHTVVPSASLIPHHPSAPMFTNSGMMPFVPQFLGEEPVPWDPRRAVSVQRCVRAGGKHNDLDAIGRSPRHLSFFEMLGNFSFGDYFKTDAIRFAWEFVTGTLGLDGDRIWVSVHVDDDEAAEIWVDEVAFPAERIVRFDKDNFWEMGDVGPCGPSSELFWDYGPEIGPDGGPANPAAEDRFVEIWNLVFQQYFRQPDGTLTDLPSKNIDTGAGLERIASALVGDHWLYAADTLSRLVDKAQSLTGRLLGRDPQDDIGLRLMADHARTMTFLVADGVVPSNDDRGYVLRRIIRRAIRFAYLLGVEDLVMPAMADEVITVMGGAYPYLLDARDGLLGVLEREEGQFRRTLRTGLGILDAELAALPEGGTLPGEVGFTLHDTHGFPLEVTTELVADRGYQFDQAGFDRAMADQRNRAKAHARKGGVAAGDEAAAFAAVLDEHGPTSFVGRDVDLVDGTVVAVVPSDDDPTLVSIFLDRTPFYAESGGQVGDTGTITTDTGRADVVDTTAPLPGLHRHHARIVEGEITAGQLARAEIDHERRAAIRRNHTATHLLHWALRTVLGEHVKQQGSLVAPDRLRFDFSHYEQVTTDQIRTIEDLANHDILGNAPVHHFETTKEHAAELGAIAFFGEKYGDRVRVLEAGEHSIELCGGTHVQRLGDIGPLKIVSEGSIGSNIRRIEAVTGTGPIDRLRAEEDLVAQAAARVGVPSSDLLSGIDKRVAELDDLRDELKGLRRRMATSQAGDLAAQAIDGVVVARVDGITRDDVRDLALAVRDKDGIRGAVLGGAPDGGGVTIVAAVRPGQGLHAGDLIADAAKTVRGGGGKGADLAQAGGKDPSQLDDALNQARAAAGIPPA